MTINKKIGRRIRQLRKEKNLSAQKLSELSGATKTYITAVERGEMNISINKLKALIDALDCNMEVVINEN